MEASVHRARAARTLRRCAAAGPFFAVSTEADPGGGWHPAAALHTPGPELAGALAAVRAWASGTDRRVAASLFVMSYAGRLLSTALAGVLLDGVLLDLRAHRWRYRPGHGVQLLVSEPGGWSCADPAAIGDALFEAHLAPMFDAVRRLAPLAPRVLWGNVASSAAGALGALAATAAVPVDDCRALGDALLRHPRLRGTGGFDRPPLGFRRRTCCLYYRLPGGGLCADCVLTHVPCR